MKQKLPSIVAGLVLLPQLAFSTPCADRLQKEYENHKFWRNVNMASSILVVPAFFVHNHYIMANKFERASKLVRQVEAFATSTATAIPGAFQATRGTAPAAPSTVDEITQLHRDLVKRPASKSATLQQVRAAIWDMAKTNSGICFAPPRPEEYRKHLKWDNIVVMVEKHLKVEALAAERKKEDQKRGAEQLAAAQRAAAPQQPAAQPPSAQLAATQPVVESAAQQPADMQNSPVMDVRKDTPRPQADAKSESSVVVPVSS